MQNVTKTCIKFDSANVFIYEHFYYFWIILYQKSEIPRTAQVRETDRSDNLYSSSIKYSVHPLTNIRFYDFDPTEETYTRKVSFWLMVSQPAIEPNVNV